MNNYTADFLVERPADQQFWVVRASGGDYARHFSQHSVIAIGHIDELRLPEGAISSAVLESLEFRLEKNDPDRPKSSITSHANQVRTFCTNMKDGDLVLTVNAQRALVIGRIAGEAAIHRKPLEIGDIQGNIYSMPHELRRNVVWGPVIPRKNIPSSFEMTMLAHQTVFNIDGHWEPIYHLIYPFFRFGNNLYLSTNIRSEEALQNYSVAQLFSFLSGIEIAAKTFNPKDGSYDLVKPAGSKLNLNLTTKAEFMSPGAIWSMVPLPPVEMVWAIVLYLMVFGGDVKFFKTDGLIDTHTRQKLWELAVKLMEKYHFKETKSTLKLDVPRAKTDALETKRKPRSKSNVVSIDTEPPQTPPTSKKG